MSADEIAWRPSPEYLERSRLRRFIRDSGLADLATLQERAIADPARFWDAVVKDLGLEFWRPFRQVLDLSRGLPWPRWFVDGGFNYTWNCLDRWVRAGEGDRSCSARR